MSYTKKPTSWTKQAVMDEVDHLVAVAWQTDNLDATATNHDVWLLLHGAIAALDVCQAIVSNGGFDATPDADPAGDLSHKLQRERKMYHMLVEEGRFDG